MELTWGLLDLKILEVGLRNESTQKRLANNIKLEVEQYLLISRLEVTTEGNCLHLRFPAGVSGSFYEWKRERGNVGFIRAYLYAVASASPFQLRQLPRNLFSNACPKRKKLAMLFFIEERRDHPLPLPKGRAGK